MRSVNSSNTEIEHPFPRWVTSMEPVHPDLVARLPGAETRPRKLTWDQIALAVEVKSDLNSDSIQKNSSKADQARIQPAKNVCKLLTAHWSLCSYTVGIYGRQACILDHTSDAIASLLLDYVKHPHILLNFLYRLTHPDFDLPGAVLGHDRSSHRASAAEVDSIGMPDLDGRDRICDRVVILLGCGKYYLLLRSRSRNHRLFSCATAVREVLEVFRLPQGDDAVTTRWTVDARQAHQMDSGSVKAATDDYVPARVIIKEAWRQCTRHRARIINFHRERNLGSSGLLNMLYGKDLGDADDSPTLHLTRSSAWKLFEKEDIRLAGERSHIRVVPDSVGVPLSEFKSTKELVQAMRDAIRGHLRASLAGVPQRDVSNGNIIIIRDPCRKHTGFLDDFDYGCLVDSQHYVDADGNRGSPLSGEDLKMVDELKRGLKERKSTPQFISIALLQVRNVERNVYSNGELIGSEPIEHAVCHDLESFYWLLIWVVLRHTKHSIEPRNEECSMLFDASMEARMAMQRLGHLGMMPVLVPGNGPLSWLLRRLKLLVAAAYLNKLDSHIVIEGDQEVYVENDRPARPLSYESVLRAFDRALAMDGWPENDKAIPFPPPTLRQKPNEPSDGTLNLGSSSKQKGSVRENGQSSLPTTVEASTHHGAYYGTKKGPDLPHLHSIAGPSGTATEPSASGAESTKRRKRDWSEILPPREQHERRAKRVRQN